MEANVRTIHQLREECEKETTEFTHTHSLHTRTHTQTGVSVCLCVCVFCECVRITLLFFTYVFHVCRLYVFLYFFREFCTCLVLVVLLFVSSVFSVSVCRSCCWSSSSLSVYCLCEYSIETRLAFTNTFCEWFKSSNTTNAWPFHCVYCTLFIFTSTYSGPLLLTWVFFTRAVCRPTDLSWAYPVAEIAIYFTERTLTHTHASCACRRSYSLHWSRYDISTISV